MNRIVEQNTSPLRTLAASLSVSEQAELSNVLGAVKLADHFAPRRGRFQADHPGLFATLTDHVGNVDAFLVASAHASVEVPVEISAQVVKIIDATTGADSVAFEPVLEKLVQENTRLVLILSGASDESAQALRVDLNRQLTAILKVAGKSEASAQNQLTVESSSLTERELSVHIERTFLGGSIRGKTAVVSGNERVLERVRSELRFLDDLGTSEARVQSDALLRVMDAARNPRIVEGRSGIISLTTWFGEVQRREGEKKITSRSA